MAFRASTRVQSAGTSIVANAPAGLTDGDWLWAMVAADVASQVITPPSGWTSAATALDPGSPDGHSYRLYRKVASSEPSSWTWTIGNSTDCTIVVGAWSGRDTAATVTPVETNNTTNNGTPISVAMNGVTAASGDDIAVFFGLDKAANDGIWGSTPPTNYTEREDGDTTSWVYGGYLCTRDNVSSGATGTLTATATRSAGSGGAGFSGWVIALPATGGGGPTFVPRSLLLGVG